MPDLKAEFERLIDLREDALRRGYLSLAMAYGISAIRVGMERIDEQSASLKGVIVLKFGGEDG